MAISFLNMPVLTNINCYTYKRSNMECKKYSENTFLFVFLPVFATYDRPTHTDTHNHKIATHYTVQVAYHI